MHLSPFSPAFLSFSIFFTHTDASDEPYIFHSVSYDTHDITVHPISIRSVCTSHYSLGAKAATPVQRGFEKFRKRTFLSWLSLLRLPAFCTLLKCAVIYGYHDDFFVEAARLIPPLFVHYLERDAFAFVGYDVASLKIAAVPDGVVAKKCAERRRGCIVVFQRPRTPGRWVPSLIPYPRTC